MVRIQIQLTESQRRAVRELAHDRQRSEAAIVREAIDLYLSQIPGGRRERMAAALAHAGRHRSGRSDVSTQHDEYLAEAIAGDE